MNRLTLSFVCIALLLSGCSSSSESGSGSQADGGSGESGDDAGSTTAHDGGSSTPKDGGSDAGANVGVASEGAENKSCTDACKAQSKHCTPTCQFNDSVHGTAVGPYAGSGFYSYTTTDSSGSFTTNAMRFEASCDTVFTSKWSDNPDDPGTDYVVDYTYMSSPISCCCAP